MFSIQTIDFSILIPPTFTRSSFLLMFFTYRTSVYQEYFNSRTKMYLLSCSKPISELTGRCTPLCRKIVRTFFQPLHSPCLSNFQSRLWIHNSTIYEIPTQYSQSIQRRTELICGVVQTSTSNAVKQLSEQENTYYARLPWDEQGHPHSLPDPPTHTHDTRGVHSLPYTCSRYL